ncbi:MAG: cysteine hydrolase [Candidatus Aenigmarchaeota archaeon]|nr:cysteine hydrolase [Candidatus Aenigmarchaeota archaeon]
MPSALIVIDVQEAFINNASRQLPPKIKDHLAAQSYDFVVFSKFINRKDSNFVKKLGWAKCTKPPETDIAFELRDLAESHTVFERSTYSVFGSEGFLEFLKAKKIDKLHFCGLYLEACVMASVFDAFDHGFDYEIMFDLSECFNKAQLDSCTKKLFWYNFGARAD